MAKDAASAALLKPVAKSDNRNVFPLDNRQIYSMKAGQITPVKALHFIPGDHFEIKPSDFTMTFPMNTAAFMRGRKEFSFYSVYYSAVWSLYNQYMATREDPKTSAFEQGSIGWEPRVKLGHLYVACLTQWYFYMAWTYGLKPLTTKYPAQYPNEAYLFNQFKNTRVNFLFGTGFDFQVDFKNSELTDQTSLWSSWTIESIWGSLVDPYYSISNELSLNNKTKISDIALDMTGHFRAYSWMRKLDMLGYGNIYPLFQKLENDAASYVSVSSHDLLDSDKLNEYCESALTAIIKMTCTYSGTISTTSSFTPKVVNLYPICAYNLIFYHFFRNSFYDLDYSARNYNLDFAYITGDFNGAPIDFNYFGARFLDIEYHQWKKDLFTSVLPDTQFGAVASIDISRFTLQSRTSGVRALSIGSDSSVGASSAVTSGNSPSTWNYTQSLFDINSAFDVIAVKRAEMLQQYRQTLMRAGNRTSDIFKALYGGAPSSEHEDDIIPRFLSTFGEDISVDPVVATATTGQESNGQLGDLSARGKFRGDGSEFKVNVGKNFGVILCLAYVVPTSEYNSYLLDKHVLELSPEQHFLPAYENFGLEAIYSDELNGLIPANDVKALGFASRYYHKKTALDLVHGAFCSVPSSVLEHLIGNSSLAANFTIADWFGDFNHWVSPRSDMQSLEFSRLSDFYINPSILDNVFVRAAGPSQADDQFICTTYFQVKSTRALSKVGLINFV